VEGGGGHVDLQRLGFWGSWGWALGIPVFSDHRRGGGGGSPEDCAAAAAQMPAR
jgi:hypothetical protein